MMTKTLTAGLMALSLTVTPIAAAPAHADGRDVVEALVGIAALLVIVDKLDGDNDKQTSNKVYRTTKTHKAHRLPRGCVRQVQVKGKIRNVVLDRCLDRHGFHRHLPQSCEMPRVSRHFGTEAYRVGCLTDRGYRVVGR